ncbi:MAG: sialidase [Pirellulaceae bacterium]|nr:MAG: sialidase [Pirellulaceae bacterium]
MARHSFARFATPVTSSVLVMTWCWCTLAADVTVHYPTWPLLIGNERGPVLQLHVRVPEGESWGLESIELSLEGTESLDDIARLELYRSEPDNPWSTAHRLAEGVVNSQEVRLACDQELSSGQHSFWLACRLAPSAKVGRLVQIRLQAVGTSQGRVRPVAGGRRGPQRVGVALRQAGQDGVHTYRIPALATTPRGTLLCVYDMRRRSPRDLQGDIDIGLSRSTDAGQTWAATHVIMDMGTYGGLPEEQNGCSDPGLIVDHQTGTVFCFAVWMHGKPGKHQWRDDGSEPGYEIGKTAQLLMVRSDDDGVTWSKPVNLTRQVKPYDWWLLVHSPQQGIQLADGTLVMPAQGRNETGRKFSTLLVSRDHGATWQVGTPADHDTSECQAVELSDGSIMLNMRNDREKFRSVAITRDLGKTWTEHPTSRRVLIEPTCNGSLLRVALPGRTPPHVLLFANPHSQQARTHQSIQVSFDDGMTWPESHRMLLDEGRGFGYPSLTQVDADRIGIVYEGSQAHLVFERIRLSDLVSGSR